MSSPIPSSTPTSEACNGDTLPARPLPKLFNSRDGSGPGTPIGFQRPHNKHLDHAVDAALRHPSPQPTHLGVPGTPHQILADDPGYIAATFEGKQKQMEQGMRFINLLKWH